MFRVVFLPFFPHESKNGGRCCGCCCYVSACPHIDDDADDGVHLHAFHMPMSNQNEHNIIIFQILVVLFCLLHQPICELQLTGIYWNSAAHYTCHFNAIARGVDSVAFRKKILCYTQANVPTKLHLGLFLSPFPLLNSLSWVNFFPSEDRMHSVMVTIVTDYNMKHKNSRFGQTGNFYFGSFPSSVSAQAYSLLCLRWHFLSYLKFSNSLKLNIAQKLNSIDEFS